MNRLVAAALAGGMFLVVDRAPETPLVPSGHAPAPSEVVSHEGPLSFPAAELDDVIQRYCRVCHNDVMLTGNLSLERFRVDAAPEQADTAERMIRKLRAGMMPPPGAPRPSADTLDALVNTLETLIDDAAKDRRSPGTRPFQRLNRAEYERLVQDILGLTIDPGEWLPADQISASFDNIADAQAVSPTLMDAYLTAASEVARQAIGQRDAPVTATTYTNAPSVSQHEWEAAEGAPYGTRGGHAWWHGGDARLPGGR